MRWLEGEKNRTERPPEGVALNVKGERTEYVLGVDIGQKRDHTAMALVERSQVTYQERSALSYRPFEKTEFRLRFLGRLELGLTYTQIVAAVEETVRELRGKASSWERMPQISVVVDATGVGTAVTDLLTAAGLGCDVVAVTITAGERSTQTRFGWNVPKKELITDLQVMYENDELLMAEEMEEVETLVKELSEMQVRFSDTGHESFAVWRSGAHDDLVLAVALAVWRAKWRRKSPWGTVRLI